MEKLSTYIGNKIKEFRKQHGMTQSHLADLLGTTRQSISRYEIGERKANQDILFKLSDIFNVSIDDFFPEAKEEKSNARVKNINTIYNQLINSEKNKVYNFAEQRLKQQNKLKETVQVYGQTAAGAPVDYVDGFVDEEEVSEVPEGANRALRIKGSSM